MSGLTNIEIARAANIARNRERLAAVGLDQTGLDQTFPDLLARPSPSIRRKQRVKPSLPPSSVVLRVRGPRPQYCDEVNNDREVDNEGEASAASSDSYTPSTETMSDAGDEPAAASLAAAEPGNQVEEWEQGLEEVSGGCRRRRWQRACAHGTSWAGGGASAQALFRDPAYWACHRTRWLPSMAAGKRSAARGP